MLKKYMLFVQSCVLVLIWFWFKSMNKEGGDLYIKDKGDNSKAITV